MAVLDKSKRLKKDLGLPTVYAVATGTTLSAGFFLLPGLAAEGAGAAIILSYMIAAIPLIPAALSIAELATATPRAGGAYYFLDRSMGPMVGTIGGLGTWLSLILKTAFALVGMGAYLHLFIHDVDILYIAVALALFFGIFNMVGAKASGGMQVVLVTGLLLVLSWFIGFGLQSVELTHFDNMLDVGGEAIFGTAGMVYISYVGVTKIASISEEVKNPERNLPLGLGLAVLTSILVYGLGIFVMVGLVPMSELAGDVTPVASAAFKIAGKTGMIVVSVGAILAFSSVANAGIMSASRYPLAMSRDHLLPRVFGKLAKNGLPIISILLTVSFILIVVIFMDPSRIAKLASAFQLAMFAMICLAVIVMRESQISSYDPSFKSPLYPWMQFLGILMPLYLMSKMGWIPLTATVVMILGAGVWFWYYARAKVQRNGAIYHVFERLGRHRYSALDVELRSILKEKGIRADDPFDDVLASADFLDAAPHATFERITQKAAESLSEWLDKDPKWIAQQFLDGTRIGATPVERGVALPHFRSPELKSPRMVIVRCQSGFSVTPGEAVAANGSSKEETIFAAFYLISPESDPGQHLRMLAHIAQHVETDEFMPAWLAARDELEIKEILLREERMVALHVRHGSGLEPWIGKEVRDLDLPPGALIALVRRGDTSKVPGAQTIIKENDRLTIIGEPEQLLELYRLYTGREPKRGVQVLCCASND
ncbi:amino acid permease [Myxococcota bacterium]|nr:amino acid permease [Myxococcota bacterium]